MTPRTRLGVASWEVLLVLAIVVFLAAILFPIFQHPHEGGNRRRTGCGSDLKQLGLAYVQYIQDSDGALPPGVTPAGGGWAGQVYPFVKSVGVYRCPADDAPGPHISYAENQNLLHQTINNFSNPGATVELYEATTLNCDPSSTSPPESVSATGNAAPRTSDRHNPQTYGLNFLAVDGHVKFSTPAQVSSGPNAQTAQAITQIRTGPVFLTFSVK